MSLNGMAESRRLWCHRRVWLKCSKTVARQSQVLPVRACRLPQENSQDNPASPSAIARILYRGPGQARLLSCPPDARGWRARGRCRRRFKIRISLRKCGSASRRATRTSLNARAHLRPSSSASPTVVNGMPAPGRAFRAPSRSGVSRSEVAASPHRDCRHYLTASPARHCGQASTAAPSASSWRAAHIGHQAEPRRRPSAWEERSSPARGRRIRLHHQTPHDDAPRSSRTQCDYYPIGIKSRDPHRGPVAAAKREWHLAPPRGDDVRCRQNNVRDEGGGPT